MERYRPSAQWLRCLAFANPGKTLTPISNAGVCPLDRHADGEREQKDPSPSRENLVDARGNRTYIPYYTAILTSIVYHEYTFFKHSVGAYIHTDPEKRIIKKIIFLYVYTIRNA